MRQIKKYFLWFLAGALLACMALVACAPVPPHKIGREQALEVVAEEDWPELKDDMDVAGLQEACRQSLAYLQRVPPERRFYFGPLSITAARMIQGVVRLQEIFTQYPDLEARTQALRKDFVLLRSVGSDGKGRVLFTGYYEPVVPARRESQPPFVHPLYALPQDMVFIDLSLFDENLPKRRLVGQLKGNKVTPYPDREAIDFKKALEGKAKPLAYLADPVEAFFLHIQGSGQVAFPDGERLRLGYAASNGQPYRSIGRYLISQGLMDPDNMSMQAIKEFLEKKPELLRKVLSHNPSYVFFRPLPAYGGPLGCYEVPLTAGRSIATDRRFFPGLALAFVKGEVPAPAGGVSSLSRFVLNQDTGGAIRGPGRVDLFFGTGSQAGELAGRMKNLGELYFLAPKEP